MTRMFSKKLILAALVGAIGLAFDTTSAHAFWRWHHGSSGCWGSSGGCSGGSSGGCWGWGSSGGSWGHHRHWRHHGSSGCWGSSGGSSGGCSGGCWGSSGGSSGGCWGSSGGCSGGCSGGAVYYGSSGGCSGGCAGGTVVTEGQPYEVQSQPAVTPEVETPMPEGTEPPADASTRLSRDAVMLSVWVPTDAKIFVNGNTTSSTGSARSYVSRGLQPGASYSYEIRAEVVRDGRTLTETKQVTVVAGQKANLE
ncbi:MAG: TIGR03000 domain-containing protein, partial [Planctomycetaceae bacterium]|nr:TIGR03000 domain-containing protein [Planctomycetaceae bacterium]